MRRLIYIFVGIFTFLVGISIVQMIPKTFGVIKCPAVSIAVPEQIQPQKTQRRFIYLGDEIFKFSDNMSPSADNSVMKEKKGDIIVKHRTELNPDRALYLLKKQCEKDKKYLADRRLKTNENGDEFGKECIVFNPYKGISIFWTEGKEFWSIYSWSPRLAKEFQHSEDFKLYRDEN